MNIAQQKQHLRSSMKERMSHFSAKEREAESRSICRRIKDALPHERLVICGYYPMPTEANLLPLYEQLLEQGCTIALPRTEGKSFAFRIIESMEQLEQGPFSIMEPKSNCEPVELSDVQYVFVPGVAFDPTGLRLGRGNGGYDKWISALRSENDAAECWGIAFDCQMVNIIPAEPHDEKLDAVITPRQMLR